MALALTYEAADNPINSTSYLLKKTVVSHDLVCSGIANNGFAAVYGSTEIGIPGTGGISTGTFTFEVEVVGQSANTGDFSATIFRMNSAGNAVGQSSDVFITGNSWGNGVKTFTWSSPSLGTWAAGDRFVVRVEPRWLGGTGTTGSITLRFKADGKTRIIVPWDPNVLEAPEDLTEWTQTNATVTADAITAPNGNTVADRVRETATAGCILANPTPHSLTSGDTWTYSYFVFPEGRNAFYLSLANSGMAGVKFLCTGNGSVISSDAGYSGTIQKVGGVYAGWWRLQITRTIPTTQTYAASIETLLDTGAVPGSGDSTKGYSGFGAVLENASSASAYPGVTISNDVSIFLTALSIGSPSFDTMTVSQQTPTTKTLVFLSGSSWTVPSDFSLPATVECIGGGGGGNRTTSSTNQNRGGGGGGYAKKSLAGLTIGAVISMQIGGAGLGYNMGTAAGGVVGTAQAATNGGDTWFNATTYCLARGGRQGADQAVGAVNGGGQVAGAANVGDTIASGGNGGIAGPTWGSQGTGGGGAAGPNGAGAKGGDANTGTNAGSGGGGANGGSAGAQAQASGNDGGAGGNNRSGTGGGAGGVQATGVGGQNGSNGGGGGGGDYAGDSAGNAGNGSQDSVWNATAGGSYGPGSGGGAGGTFGNGGTGGNGGGYGGGGGAAGISGSGTTTNKNGDGTQGIIVIFYTASTTVVPTALTTGSPSLPTFAAAQNIQVTITPMSSGSPSLPSLTMTQRHNVSLTPLSISSPSFIAYVVTQIHKTTLTGLSISSPSMPTFLATQAQVIVLTPLATSSPSLPTLAATQVHAIVMTPLAIASPSLPTIVITQVQVIAFTPLTISSPSLPGLVVTQVHLLSLANLATAPPSLPTLTVSRNFVVLITPEDIASPALPTLAATQVHTVVLTPLSISSPALPTAAVTQVHVVALTPQATSSPVLPTIAATQAQVIALNRLDISSPALPSIAVTQVHRIVFAALTAGSPSLATVTIVVNYTAVIAPKTLSSPVLPTFIVSQVHSLRLNALTIGSPQMALVPAMEYWTLEPTSSTAGNWTTNTGGSDLEHAVDEVVPDDTDYIHTPPDPVNEIAELNFTFPSASKVVGSPILVRYRIGKEVNNTRQIDQTIRLFDGATLLAQWQHLDVPYGETTIEQSVAITQPPVALRIEVEANAP